MNFEIGTVLLTDVFDEQRVKTLLQGDAGEIGLVSTCIEIRVYSMI